MKSLGFWPMGADGPDVVSADLGEDLLGATITGTPTVTGVNCTAIYQSHTPEGVVSALVSAGEYAGSVQFTLTLSDGRSPSGQVDLRFL